MNCSLRAVVVLGGVLAVGAGMAAETQNDSDERRFTGLTHAEYQNVFNELAPKGFVPTAVRGYSASNEARYDLTMRKTRGGAWAAHHGMPQERFERADRKYKQEGMDLVAHGEFRVHNQVLHVAVWRARPVTFHTSDVIPETGRTSRELAPLDELMRSFVKRHDIPGATLAVARHGRLLYSRGFGFADVERHVSVQPDSLFRIASVSKPITAIAVLRLVERGKLKLSDRALDLLKFKPADHSAGPTDARWRDVTVIQLLQHTGGFDRDKSEDPMFRTARIARELHVAPPAGPEAIVRYMFGRPLDFDPGTRYAYSNLGYCVLGRIIESVTGKFYESYVRDEVLNPIGITRMRIGATREDQRAEGEVRYYTREKRRAVSVFAPDTGVRVPVQYGGWSLEAMDAHGGWIASAIDLVRFASAVDEDSKRHFLSNRALIAMFAPPAGRAARDNNGNLTPSYYACGWQVRPVGDAGKATTWHLGRFDGTSALLFRRHDGFTWAVLFNIDQTKDFQRPAEAIDGLIRAAVDRVECWPSQSKAL